MSTRKTLAWTLGPAVAFVLILVAIGAYVSTKDLDIEDDYNEMSAEVRERAYPRPAPNQGWQLEPGTAAEAYQAAVDDKACQIELEAPDLQEKLVELGGAENKLPTPCTGLVCDAITRCRSSINLLHEGARRAEARSPMHVWDAWRVDTNTGSRDGIVQFVRLARLASLDARARKDWAGLANVMRFGQDMGRGSSLLGVMIGAAVSGLALTQLKEALEQGELDAASQGHMRRELAYLDEHEPGLRNMLVGERLVMFSPLLSQDALRPPAGLPHGSFAQGGFMEGLMLKDLAEKQWATWNSMEQAAGKSFPERQANYDKLVQQAQGSLNPLVKIGTAAYGKYDKKYTIRLASRRLLRRALGDDTVTDPLTDTPFRETKTADTIAWESTFDRARLDGEDPEILKVTLSARPPASPEAAPSSIPSAP